MVERQPGRLAGQEARGWCPARLGGVGAGMWEGQPGSEGEVGDGDHPHPRIAAWGAVTGQLL